MKSFAFVAILFAVAGVAESRISVATDDSFLNFMSEHGKEYSSLSEANYRRMVYLDNIERINKHNADPSHTWSMAMNEFGDLTAEEFKKFYVNGLQGYKTNSAEQVDLSELVTIPDAVDWRVKHAVSEVKNQGQCGSCWAFSTTGAVEGATAIKHNQLFSLSEQELMDCSKKDGNQGCSGGLMDYGFTFVRDNKGLCLEKDYSYKAAEGTCHDQTCSKHGQISKWVDVKKNNQLALKAAVAIQPVSVAIEADSMMFQFYHSGVFNWFWCGTSLDHGVLAVGYGTENGKDYWLVKNSWGATWGDKGYIKIYRTDNTSDPGKCGIAMQPSYPISA